MTLPSLERSGPHFQDTSIRTLPLWLNWMLSVDLRHASYGWFWRRLEAHACTRQIIREWCFCHSQRSEMKTLIRENSVHCCKSSVVLLWLAWFVVVRWSPKMQRSPGMTEGWSKMAQQLLFEMLKCLLTVTESCRDILKDRQQENKKALISVHGRSSLFLYMWLMCVL